MHAERHETDLQTIQQLVRVGQFDAALAELEALLVAEPDHLEALYTSAVCQRYSNRLDTALEVLSRLLSLSPGHSRAYQEQGHTLRGMGRFDHALAAYARACQLNPALEASWRCQLEILLSKGMHAQAQQVKLQLERLQKLPKPLIAVTDLIAQGRLIRAEELCRQFLQKVPHHVEAMRLLADIGIRFGVLEDAEFLLESAVEFAPDNLQLRIEYIQALRKRQKFTAALEQARLLLDSAPENPQFMSLFAVECMQTGDFDTALQYFDKVLQKLRRDPVTLTSKGHALKTCGEPDAAIDAYHLALDSHPSHGEAWYSLANLKTYTFAPAEIAAMHSQEKSPQLGHQDRVYVCFALGKAYEDQGEFARSFDYYDRGNRLKKAESRYRAEKMSAEMQAQVDSCTAEMFANRNGAGCAAPDPIFVVGLPRAGSTLLEQILSSHSQVDGTLELPNILSLSHRLRRRGASAKDSNYPATLQEFSDDELTSLGEEYIRDTSIHRRGAAFFVDKMPNNFRHLGLIKLILPNAKIIDARRHPLACGFSGFKQLFAEGQEFTYTLGDIGRYYRDYVALMDHWDTVLPGFVLRVQYEDVVADLEAQVRRLLKFCGLPFEPACLSYHDTERSIRTPSSEQVRQPIFRSGLDQWRNYEPYLDPLVQALGPELLARYPG